MDETTQPPPRPATQTIDRLEWAFTRLGTLLYSYRHRNPVASAIDQELEVLIARAVDDLDKLDYGIRDLYEARFRLQLLDEVEWLLLPYFARGKHRAAKTPAPRIGEFTPARGDPPTPSKVDVEAQVRAAYDWFRVLAGRHLADERYLPPLDDKKTAAIHARINRAMSRPEDLQGVRQEAGGLVDQLVGNAGTVGTFEPTVGGGRSGHGRGGFGMAAEFRRAPPQRHEHLGGLGGPIYFGAEYDPVDRLRYLATRLGATEVTAAGLRPEFVPVGDDSEASPSAHVGFRLADGAELIFGTGMPVPSAT